MIKTNKKKCDLVILVGGKGSRIKSYLKNLPKPMIKINNKSFLEYVLLHYSAYHFNKIYLLCGFRSNQIIKKYHKKKINFTEIICLTEKKPMGTGGALNIIKKKINNDFILVNGDTFVDFDLNKLIKKKTNNNIYMVVSDIKKNTGSKKLTNLNVKNKKIIFSNKGKYFNNGIYKFSKNFLKKISKNHSSLENDILKKEILKKKVIPIISNNFFIDIGTPKSLLLAKKILAKKLTKSAVFLDRDGVINYDYGYVYKKKNFHFKKGVLNGLKYLIKKKYYIFIATNQSGIAKNKYSLVDFENLHKWLKEKLFNYNIVIHETQFCPFHKDATIKKYKKISKLRKPENLMIKKIFNNWHINLKKSFFIGDQISDEICANKSGIKFYYTKKNFFNLVKEILH